MAGFPTPGMALCLLSIRAELEKITSAAVFMSILPSSLKHSTEAFSALPTEKHCHQGWASRG